MDEIIIRPREDQPVWVVQSVCGRDRKRVFLAFRQAAEEKNPAVHGTFPSIYTVNGTLHRVECPKKKHLSHVKVIGTLNDEERNALFSDYSNKTAASLVQKYDEFGELLQKRENSENLY
ncbi:MAG: hypothetical protein IKY52_06205 [Clostridia bacterium]|nr:hypothetical protein [Clostridia bacterium]